MPKDYYFQPNAPDPVLSAEQALAIARLHAPESRAVTGIDETGGEARTYAIDEGLILKTQRPHRLRSRTSLKKEALFLRRLEGLEGVMVPKVLGHGRLEPAIEYTLMTRMPGVALRNAKLEGDARAKALKALGRMLRRVHSIPQGLLHESGLFPGDRSPVDLVWRMGNGFDEIGEKIKKEGMAWSFPLSPEAIGRKLLSSVPDEGNIAALHSNPGPEHVFVDPVTGELTGIIDFGDAYFSHPVNDLRRYRAPQDRGSVLEGYLEGQPAGEGFMALWLAGCALADISAIAFSPECRLAAAAELEGILARNH